MYLSKLLAPLAYPLTLCLLLVPTGLLMRRRWRRAGAAMIAFGLGWLLLWSLPMASFWLRAGLERQTAWRAAPDYPTAEAIVVLGGGVVGKRSGWRDEPDLQAAADRVWFAARLYHAGRAPLVILSGGTLDDGGSEQAEADGMARFIADLGVPSSALLLERRSRNTLENARETAALLHERGIGPVLLVTSALHMPRARAMFRQHGIEAIPAPTDFEAAPPIGPWPVRCLPDAKALEASTRAFKEYLGLGVHWLRGLVGATGSAA